MRRGVQQVAGGGLRRFAAVQYVSPTSAGGTCVVRFSSKLLGGELWSDSIHLIIGGGLLHVARGDMHMTAAATWQVKVWHGLATGTPCGGPVVRLDGGGCMHVMMMSLAHRHCLRFKIVDPH